MRKLIRRYRPDPDCAINFALAAFGITLIIHSIL